MSETTAHSCTGDGIESKPMACPRIVHRLLRLGLPASLRLPGVWRLFHHVLDIKRCSFPDGPIRVRNRFGLRMWVKPNDLIGRQIFYTGAWEPDIAEHFYDSVRPGDTVVDLGGNIGQYTLLAAKRVGLSGKVFSVEPSSLADTLLRDNVNLNSLENVQILKMAAWSSNGWLTLKPGAEDNCGTAEVCEEREANEGIRVPARRIAEVLREYGCTRIDVVKLDIEGAELPALKGMSELFDGHPPRAVYCELLRANLTDEVYDEHCRFFSDRGYKGWVFSEDGLIPFDASAISPQFEGMLFFQH